MGAGHRDLFASRAGSGIPPTNSIRSNPVAIVGGGFSGVMAAAQLARRGIESLLIEATDRAGLGTAYSTREPAHVLNVRAENMSGWHDDPDHFVRFLESHGGQPRDFAQRRLFGRYLRQILDRAVASGRVTLHSDRAVAARPARGGWAVELDGGTLLDASAMVLASGNQPPQQVGDQHGGRLVDSPWSEQAQQAIVRAARHHSSVLLLGTGLTMVDVVLSLDAAGHRGNILALSRRGLAPRAHAEFEPAPVALEEVPLGSVKALSRFVRWRSASVGWRAAVDALRPHSARIWQAFGPAEQQRFLRHSRPWWDVHRHRIAPAVAKRLDELVEAGRLEIVAGRVCEIREEQDSVCVNYRPRGADGVSQHRNFDFVFDCTGPLHAISRTRDPLLKQLLSEGLARPDQLGIGLEVDNHSRVVGASRLWALGPLTKGRYWEIVAVPDIRGQVSEVAEDIAMVLGQ